MDDPLGYRGKRALVTGEAFNVDGGSSGTLQTGQIDFSRLLPADS